MIKRILLSIVLTLFMTGICIGGPTSDLVIRGGDGGGVVCDDCSGTLKFAWHMEDNDATPDVTIGNPCGCSDNDEVGAGNETPVFSTTQKSDGSYSLLIDALDDRYSFDVTGDDLIEADDVKVTFDLWIVSYPGTAGQDFEIIYTKKDASNYIILRLSHQGGSQKLYFTYVGQGDSDSIGIVGIETGVWHSCEFQALAGGPVGNDMYLACAEHTAETDGNLTAMAASMDTLTFGDTNGDEIESYYLDNVTIGPSDRY